MLHYSLLHLAGFEDMTIDELKQFRQWGSRTAGHPEFGHALGIEILQQDPWVKDVPMA